MIQKTSEFLNFISLHYLTSFAIDSEAPQFLSVLDPSSPVAVLPPLWLGAGGKTRSPPPLPSPQSQKNCTRLIRIILQGGGGEGAPLHDQTRRYRNMDHFSNRNSGLAFNAIVSFSVFIKRVSQQYEEGPIYCKTKLQFCDCWKLARYGSGERVSCPSDTFLRSVKHMYRFYLLYSAHSLMKFVRSLVIFILKLKMSF